MKHAKNLRRSIMEVKAIFAAH